MTAPLIGLTTYLQQARTGVWDVRASFLPELYLDGVTESGGIAVLLPPQPASDDLAAAVLDRLDALVLTGGADVDPARYGQPAHPATNEPHPVRDAWEDALLRVALRRGLPVLGICRGLQMINVSLGGTLHQHLPEVVGDDRYNAGNAVFTDNAVIVEPGSRLARVIDDAGPVMIKSYHHQAVDRLAPGLVVSARGADGVVQAVERDGTAFVLAVQWHPEESPLDRRLFRSLVAAAAEFATHRTDRSAS